MDAQLIEHCIHDVLRLELDVRVGHGALDQAEELFDVARARRRRVRRPAFVVDAADQQRELRAERDDLR
jgi:hypothetical protein